MPLDRLRLVRVLTVPQCIQFVDVIRLVLRTQKNNPVIPSCKLHGPKQEVIINGTTGVSRTYLNEYTLQSRGEAIGVSILACCPSLRELIPYLHWDTDVLQRRGQY